MTEEEAPLSSDASPVFEDQPDQRRGRGLDAPFAPGGEDAADELRRRTERRDLRLLLVFVAALVGIPSILTVLAVIGQLMAMRSGG